MVTIASSPPPHFLQSSAQARWPPMFQNGRKKRLLQVSKQSVLEGVVRTSDHGNPLPRLQGRMPCMSPSRYMRVVVGREGEVVVMKPGAGAGCVQSTARLDVPHHGR